MSTKSVPSEKAAFIRFELENGDDRRKKVALQEIARVYRSGGFFAQGTRNGLELIINGLLSAHQDPKVTRWCLNCLAQMGTRSGSMQSVERVLSQQVGDPEIIAAAVAAAAKLYAGRLDECAALGSVQPEIRTLAALQVTPPSKLDLNGFQITVENADDEVLKLALITVGLNRAFENMFHPRFSNGELVRALGQHDNIIVKQYSVWSVIENRGLSIDDLGIPFSRLEEEPPNVQSKLLQLAAEQVIDHQERQHIIRRGSFLPTVEAREGLAKGLLHQFYDGVHEITLDWFEFEGSYRVKELLAEHFARFGTEFPPYQDKALELLEADEKLKTRLYVGAESTPLFGKLKANDLREGTRDLFADEFDPLTAQLMEKTKLPKKKILMMCASPKDGTPLRLDEEARELKDQLRLVENPKQEIDVTHAWAIRNDQVQMEVLNATPEVLHFSGHGDSGVLCFEDRDGYAVPVSADAIEGLVELNESIECLVMNACFSESIARQVAPHVKTVIGCTVEIEDDAAVVFSKAFYRALAHGQSYRRAFDLARNELQFNGMAREAKKYSFIAA
ncbi:CHAT domain-containing protein (plasmid) [Leisingera aquaemixtae]|uniref:CHAT domain-containing protein n=1 Tax=Leisingera aquaemixtae TaxID=1396826 RepID=A0ABY5WRF0_9RHOB|nr:CHAT domain-containing protein [Leisingera aquaemixtae]UWQ43941.1 CHAT domain-containing protein [Leisingera aquaemixtae]